MSEQKTHYVEAESLKDFNSPFLWENIEPLSIEVHGAKSVWHAIELIREQSAEQLGKPRNSVTILEIQEGLPWTPENSEIHSTFIPWVELVELRPSKDGYHKYTGFGNDVDIDHPMYQNNIPFEVDPEIEVVEVDQIPPADALPWDEMQIVEINKPQDYKDAA